MKITESQLRNIVRQELITVLSEDQQQLDEGWGQKLAALGAGLGLAAGMAKGIPHDYSKPSDASSMQASAESSKTPESLSDAINMKAKDNNLIKLVGKENAVKAVTKYAMKMPKLSDDMQISSLMKATPEAISDAYKGL